MPREAIGSPLRAGGAGSSDPGVGDAAATTLAELDRGDTVKVVFDLSA
jgi:hypothetical protein